MSEESILINKSIETLWQETRDLNLGTKSEITFLSTPPTPLQFLRNFVSPNKPCLISSAATCHWPAHTLWPTTSSSYLRNTLSSTPVSVHLTPTGKADSLTRTTCSQSESDSDSSICFASAHVETVLFPEALDMVMDSKIGKRVAYLQQQNDCFRDEYGLLRGDCDGDVNFASEAFGALPEAVNLWIGNGLSETSFHKDHYENLYVVISGEKRFVLLPPTDVHRMYIREYPFAQYRYCKETGEFTLEVEEEDCVGPVPWCSVDPYPKPEERLRVMDKFPLYFNEPKPFEVTVKAGEMLYLPSMWFHHVRQIPDDAGLTIAINYWYDMSFDIKYAYFNFLQSIPHSLYQKGTLGNVESSSDISACDPENESDIAISAENPYV